MSKMHVRVLSNLLYQRNQEIADLRNLLSMSEKKRVLKGIDSSAIYTVEWIDRNEHSHIYSSTDQAAVQRVYTEKALQYSKGDIREVQIKAEV